MKSLKSIFIVPIGLLAFGQIHAQIITDRPNQTESSYSVGDGNLQLETGMLLGYTGEAQNSTI